MFLTLTPLAKIGAGDPEPSSANTTASGPTANDFAPSTPRHQQEQHPRFGGHEAALMRARLLRRLSRHVCSHAVRSSRRFPNNTRFAGTGPGDGCIGTITKRQPDVFFSEDVTGLRQHARKIARIENAPPLMLDEPGQGPGNGVFHPEGCQGEPAKALTGRMPDISGPRLRGKSVADGEKGDRLLRRQNRAARALRGSG